MRVQVVLATEVHCVSKVNLKGRKAPSPERCLSCTKAEVYATIGQSLRTEVGVNAYFITWRLFRLYWRYKSVNYEVDAPL